jgi:hypothetical protein
MVVSVGMFNRDGIVAYDWFARGYGITGGSSKTG